MQSNLFDQRNLEVQTQTRFSLQNSQMLRVALGPDVLAVKGAMVAYQGQIDFDYELQSLGQSQRLMLSGERLALMRCSGQGELFLADLARDPRFTLHTATVDTHVTEGDAKVWGTVEDVTDPAVHERFAEALFAESGFDLRGQAVEHFFRVDVVGASAVAVSDHLAITTWREGHDETVIRRR